MRLRLKNAVRLLLNEPRLSIKEVAARVGYAGALHFSAEFRRQYGISPRAYRRQGMTELLGGGGVPPEQAD